MEQPQQQLKRSIAFKLLLCDVAMLPFVKGDGTTSSYLQHQNGQVGRVNVIGTIVQKQSGSSAVVDDGTSAVHLRAFEDNGLLQSLEVGDVVLVIGRPREYGSGRYILPEIVKKVDAGWLRVRNKEVIPSAAASDDRKSSDPSIASTEMRNTNVDGNGGAAGQVEEIMEGPMEKIVAFIKTYDKGEGVDIESIIESRIVENVEKHVSLLLRNGDIFEIRPGRVKVLE